MGRGHKYQGVDLGVRENFPVGATDEHRDSGIGRLFMSGAISERQYQAGIKYATTILDYLKTIDAPAPYGADLSDFSDELCLNRKIEMAKARKSLSKAGRKAASVVDRSVVYGEQIAPDEFSLLFMGLMVLADN